MPCLLDGTGRPAFFWRENGEGMDLKKIGWEELGNGSQQSVWMYIVCEMTKSLKKQDKDLKRYAFLFAV